MEDAHLLQWKAVTGGCSPVDGQHLKNLEQRTSSDGLAFFLMSKVGVNSRFEEDLSRVLTRGIGQEFYTRTRILTRGIEQ